MNHRTLKRLLGAWAVGIVVLLIAIQEWASLSKPSESIVVVSHWQAGKRIARDVREAAKMVAMGEQGDVDIAVEEITGEGPLLLTRLPFELNIVAGRDGVKATLDGKTAYATPDDLVSIQAYDHAHLWVEQAFGWGTNRALVLDVLAAQLNAKPDDILARASFRRVRMERRSWQPSISHRYSAAPDTRPRIDETSLTRALVTDAMKEAATHLARDVDKDGRFRYLIEASTNRTLPGYNWPRHSGATFFLAQSAGILNEKFIRNACLRAAARLRDEMMRSCGKNRCITEEQPVAEIGSSALALIAFTEIVRAKIDESYKPVITELAAFLRSQQRPDGELMHLYDRTKQEPIDVQLLYYSGEATLGLARAHGVLGDPRDLEAAKTILSRISGKGWSFFGSRYYYSEEHWTCQSVAELWERAPDHDALAFCARWHEFQRRLQYGPNDTPYDADGAFGFGPIVTPRLTPAASRGEAAGALLAVLLHEHRTTEIPAVDHELRRALAFVLRNQFHPGPAYLFADPVAVRGALPGSPVDWQLRIDYAQHAGSMMLRWLELDAVQNPK